MQSQPSQAFKIIEGDVTEVLKTLPANFFDAVLSDPPYGINFMGKAWDRGVPSLSFSDDGPRLTAPATEAAKTWDGYGTALKPAWEPALLVQKPLEKTYAHNALAWGNGGLNIEGCRVETADNLNGGSYSGGDWTSNIGQEYVGGHSRVPGGFTQPTGRFTANLILDEEAGQALDKQADASRFFYCAKVSSRERNAGLGNEL